MSFVLPGNARSLRFTGEARAMGRQDEREPGALALGKPRVRRPPVPARLQTPAPTPVRVQPQPQPQPRISPARRFPTPVNADLHRHAPLPSPYLGGLNPPVARHQHVDDSVDDENPTMAMDRDGLDVLPGARALRAPRPAPAGRPAPIPHFRSANPAPSSPMVHAGGTASSKVQRETRRAPLAVWILAGLIAGILSYHAAPEILARVVPSAHAAAPR